MTEEQIIRLYGERCAEHCDDCCVCEVWAMHDLIETQAREIERLTQALIDPNVVHVNMLRGGIARPSISQILHIYGEDVFRAALGDTK